MGKNTEVVVIGGGYADVMAANRLTRRGDVTVTAINPRPAFVARGKRVRQFMLLAGAIATLMMMLSPTASAEPTVTAAERELDFAVRGTLPPGEELTCRATSEPATVEVCYEKNGDRWWVLDLAADGASALVYWFNYRGSGATPYREGFCVNSLGKGVWGQCDKNYYENSDLEAYPCIWDRGSGGIEDETRCNNNAHWIFQ